MLCINWRFIIMCFHSIFELSLIYELLFPSVFAGILTFLPSGGSQTLSITMSLLIYGNGTPMLTSSGWSAFLQSFLLCVKWVIWFMYTSLVDRDRVIVFWIGSAKIEWCYGYVMVLSNIQRSLNGLYNWQNYSDALSLMSLVVFQDLFEMPIVLLICKTLVSNLDLSCI